MSMSSVCDDVARVDVLKDLSKMTLDVIGLAGGADPTIPVPWSSLLARV